MFAYALRSHDFQLHFRAYEYMPWSQNTYPHICFWGLSVSQWRDMYRTLAGAFMSQQFGHSSKTGRCVFNRKMCVQSVLPLTTVIKSTTNRTSQKDLHRVGLGKRLPVFVSEYLRDHRIRVRIWTTLSDEFYPKEGFPTGGVLAVTCFGLKSNELPSCSARDILRALFIDLSICIRGCSLDTTERHLQQAVDAIQWPATNGFRFATHKWKSLISLHPDPRFKKPPT